MAAAKQYTSEELKRFEGATQQILALLKSKAPAKVAQGMGKLQNNLVNYNKFSPNLSTQAQLNLEEKFKDSVSASIMLTPELLDSTDPEKVANVISRLEQVQRCVQYCQFDPSASSIATVNRDEKKQACFNEILAHAKIENGSQLQLLIQLNDIAQKPAATAENLNENLIGLKLLREEAIVQRNQMLQAQVGAAGSAYLKWVQAQRNEQYYEALLAAIERPNFSVADFVRSNSTDKLTLGLGSDTAAVIDALQAASPMPIPELKALVQRELAAQKADIDVNMRNPENNKDHVQWAENERILGKIDEAIYQTEQKLRLGEKATPLFVRREKILANAGLEWNGDEKNIAEVEAAVKKYDGHKALNDAFQQLRIQNPGVDLGKSTVDDMDEFVKQNMKFSNILADDLRILKKEMDRLGGHMSLQQLSDFLQKQEDASLDAVSALISEGKIGDELATAWEINEGEIRYYSKDKDFASKEENLLAERDALLDKLMGSERLASSKLNGMILRLEKNKSLLDQIRRDSATTTYNADAIAALIHLTSTILNDPLAVKLTELEAAATQAISKEDLIKLLEEDQKFILAQIDNFIQDSANSDVITPVEKAAWNKINTGLKHNNAQWQRLKDDHDAPTHLKISHTDFKAIMEVLKDPNRLPANTTYTPVDSKNIYEGGTLEPKPGTGDYIAKFEKDGNVKITGKHAHTKGVEAVLSVFKEAGIKAVEIDCPTTGGKVNDDKMLSVIKATLAKEIAPVMKESGQLIPAGDTLSFILEKGDTSTAKKYVAAVMKSGDTALISELTAELTTAQKADLSKMPQGSDSQIADYSKALVEAKKIASKVNPGQPKGYPSGILQRKLSHPASPGAGASPSGGAGGSPSPAL